MRVFVTGGTGFIGSAIVRELIEAGHRVLGLARSEASAKALTAAGAEVHRGDLGDSDSLCSGVAAADGVIHAGFQHDFANFKAVSEIDRQAIDTLGGAVAGSDRPLVITSGLFLVPSCRVATEDDASAFHSAALPRAATEEAAASAAERGARISVVRAAVVHGDGDPHFLSTVIKLAREKGVSAHVVDGLNHWPAVHVLDIARLYRLALEKGAAGARYHGVAEEGVTFRAIAELVAKRLGVPLVSLSPDQAADHFGAFAMFASMDRRASSTQSQERLGWRPRHPSLLEDLDRGTYFGN
jgi:nucleoside-diphosphate-sugar epimerase